jgi:F0F1-type ATP synthase assembly protein I
MSNQEQPGSNKPQKDAKTWLTYSGMAFELFAIIALFTAVGYFIDSKINSSPILLILFLLIGLAAGFYRIFKQFS